MSTKSTPICVNGLDIAKNEASIGVAVKGSNGMFKESGSHSIVLMKQENWITARQVKAAIPVAHKTEAAVILQNPESLIRDNLLDRRDAGV